MQRSFLFITLSVFIFISEEAFSIISDYYFKETGIPLSLLDANFDANLLLNEDSKMKNAISTGIPSIIDVDEWEIVKLKELLKKDSFVSFLRNNSVTLFHNGKKYGASGENIFYSVNFRGKTLTIKVRVKNHDT